jgi:nucleotide-binding universal stress UspA family protein
MAYKTILVSLNELNRLPQLLNAAATVARNFNAHVSGLYVIPAVQLYPSMGFEAVPQVFDGNQTYFKDNQEKVRAAFEETMRKEGLNSDFHVVQGATSSIAEEVVNKGRSADLLIISATNPDETTGVESDFVEQTLMAAGRPIMVLPFKGDTKLNLDDVVLGWNGDREAARAAFDALPFLKAAKKVRIVRTDPQKDPALKGSIAGADLAETLARHGVKVEAASIPTAGDDAGHALLRCADDNGCDLIVMGAYGHSRLREYIFGGATQYVLNHLTRPVLMSH